MSQKSDSKLPGVPSLTPSLSRSPETTRRPCSRRTQAADLEAVVVTARKREETLLDIPQEIQAISQAALARANISSVQDIQRFVPSLSYNATVPGRGAIYFRGVADDSSSFIADSSAAVYLDEQPLTQSGLQPEIRLVDIERIEALPGPQGTLYGSSSQAGTLRYITNKPDPSGFYADVSVDGHSVDDGDEGYEVSGVAEPAGRRERRRSGWSDSRRAMPASSTTCSARASAATFNNADFVEDDVNAVEYVGGRAALRWLAGDNWTVDGEHRAPADGRRHLRRRQRPARRPGARSRALRGRGSQRRVDPVRAHPPGRPRLGPVHVCDQLLHPRHFLFPGQHRLHLLSFQRREPANTRTYDFGPDPVGLGWSDRDYADRWAQEFRLQGSTEKTTWLAGLFYERMENGFDFFSRIENYEDTPAFENWVTEYGAVPGTTDNSFYHSKNDQVTEQYRRLRRGGLLAERSLDPHGRAALVRPLARARVFHPAAEWPHIVRPLRGGRRPRPATSPKSFPSSTS